MDTSSSATPGGAKRSLNPLKRKSLVYVEIPPSPLHGQYLTSIGSPLSVLKRKRVGSIGTPLANKILNVNRPSIAYDTPSKMRKLSDAAGGKLAMNTSKPKIKSSLATSEATALQFPNGFFYCHQCSRKRDCNDALHCTFKNPARCRLKYCTACVRNRYGQNADHIKTQDSQSDEESSVEHDPAAGYKWKCPRCCKTCNCSPCRKAQGLEPVGRMAPLGKKSGKSTVEIELRVSAATGTSGKSQHLTHENKGQDPSAKKKVKTQEDKEENSAEQKGKKAGDIQVKPRAPRKLRAIPEPKWIGVPTDLDYEQAQDRFFVREFVLRFAPLMKIGQKHLEDLDEFDSLSDTTAKAIVMNILDLIGADADLESKKIIRDAHKRISGSGFSPNALWTHLAYLRDQLPSSSDLRIPDPTSVTTTYNMRKGEMVTQAVQLIPVIVGLIEAAIPGASIREEIENGVKDMKERNKIYFAALKSETERWQTEKDDLMEKEAKNKDTKEDGSDSKKRKRTSPVLRAKREKHKDILDKIEQTRARHTQAFAPRFRALGKDNQGREYYVSTLSETKKIPSELERANLTKWSWFLAVWGKGGGKAAEAKPRDDDDDDNEDQWWGFSEPGEIRKLAKWLEADAKTDDQEVGIKRKGKGHGKTTTGTNESGMGGISSRAASPLSDLSDADEDPMEVDWEKTEGIVVSGDDIKQLVKDLNDYADLLSWRSAGATEHDKGLGKGGSGSHKGVNDAVSVGRFYKAG